VSSEERAVTVVGAGIVGVCCGLFLQEKGFQVRIIDRDGTVEGASSGNAGILSPWSCVPESVPGLWKSVPKWTLDPMGPMAVRWRYLPRLAPWLLRFLGAGRSERIAPIADALHALYNTTIDLYESLLRGSGHESLVQRCLYVHVYRDPRKVNLEALEWRLRRERGADLEVVSAGELLEIEPDVSPDYKKAVLIRGQGRATNPGRLGKVLADRFMRQGGQFSRAEVVGLKPGEDGRVTIVTKGGEVSCPKIVLAAGAWSARLLESIGHKVPLETERGYHMTFADPDIRINNTIMETDRKFAVNMMEQGLRLAGTVELAGIDAPPDYRRARSLVTLGRQIFPKLNTDQGSEWMGHRPSLPDSLPVIGRLPDQPNILLAFGHSHLGLTGGAPTGRLIAQLAAGETPNIDLGPYSAARFS
jgi:D-amino-acid dehydrogenase